MKIFGYTVPNHSIELIIYVSSSIVSIVLKQMRVKHLQFTAKLQKFSSFKDFPSISSFCTAYQLILFMNTRILLSDAYLCYTLYMGYLAVILIYG